VSLSAIHVRLFPFQKVLVQWALRKGRAALFADTGMGKTMMQLEFARLSGERSLIIAPLSVARQTVQEAKAIDITAHYTRSGSDLIDGVNVTNYEMLDHFDPSDFGAIILDESSILKSLTGETRNKLIARFTSTPYRLCCTATPAPNDIVELANHAEFLGVMSRAEMLAMFFTHDSDVSAHSGWRLKHHAQQPFYRWMASWSMSVKKPSDLGFEDSGYTLPPLALHPVFVETNYVPEGMLFYTGLGGVAARSQVRKNTVEQRVRRVVDLVASHEGKWILWCGRNDEALALSRLLPESVEVKGSDSPEAKLAAIESFQQGRARIFVTKPRIAGFGINLQTCHQMAFVGLSDSFEAYYQCIRRCYRYGQSSPVEVFIVLSDVEQAIYSNILRKEREAVMMSEQLIAHVQAYERAEIAGVSASEDYQTHAVHNDQYTLLLGDSCERLQEVADSSIDLSVFSPPFQSLYTYSPTERDLGNSRSADEFYQHFCYIIDHLLRVIKPGRHCCVHVQQLAATLSHDGFIGLKDFRGEVIADFVERGWIYHGEICIDRNPQTQAIRTKAKGLLFVQLHKDASWMRPGLADYILVFRKPGENAVPIVPDLTNEEWIQWAHPVWYDIREAKTLNAAEGRDAQDERHVCPLQLDTIERCVRLWSNSGETILSPFCGIGSEGYVALQHGRKFLGIELKPSYFQTAYKNLERICATKTQATLFDALAESDLSA
jgi:DNA modification methylase/superfamily II DNA or RNA helicase